MPPMGSVSKVMWDLVLLLAGFLSSGQRVLAKPLLDIILPCLSFFLVCKINQVLHGFVFRCVF